MGRAKKIKCSVCGHYYSATRGDSKYCSEKCHSRNKMENSKFEFPKIPQSGIVGISFHRVHRSWNVTIPTEDSYKRKYVGSFKNLKDAIDFQKEILSEPDKCPSSKTYLNTQKIMNHQQVSGSGQHSPP